ncbi:MAG: PDZ domain-containing protein [Oscillospiraceae bacterium]|nr:PDZ domain-containing protein [Oscillospiraceae bacterium]
MNKRISLGLAISLVAIGCAITFILTWTVSLNQYNAKIASTEKYEGVYKKLRELASSAQTNYVGDIDQDAVENAILNGYVSGIGDEYAMYLSPDRYYDYQQAQNGVINGAGFEAFEDGSGYLQISKVYKNSAADLNGLKAGDMIIEINGRTILSMTADAALKQITGEVGTTIQLKTVSNGEERVVTLTRQQIDIESVTYKMLDGNIGYIKILYFNARTSEQFSNALNSLRSAGAGSFIFDVRHNDGGLITSVRPMLNRLIPAAAVATAEYANGVRRTLIETDSEESLDLPMTVLVDGKTESAAEVFAVGLRDEMGAMLIGTQTAGKGVLLNAFEFSDKSALILTTAQIIPSHSERFDKVGLKPDYVTELPAEANFSTLTDAEDTQLQKAVEILTAQTNIPTPTIPDAESTPE